MQVPHESPNSLLNAWFLTHLGTHQPDCSSISNDLLKKAIYTKWEDPDGLIRIPYTFSLTPYLSELFTILSDIPNLIPKSFGNEYEGLKESVRYALNQWSIASKGKIEFEEIKNPSPTMRGIIFNVADMADENVLGIAQTRFDNNGHLAKVLIYFADLKEKWNPNSAFWRNYIAKYGVDAAAAKFTDLFNTIPHEIGHALGFDHLHDFPEFVSKIKTIPDGIFCSVMPYPFLIENHVNSCQTECAPSLAVVPGQLDERMLDLSYHKNEVKFSYDLQDQYVTNSINAMLFSSSISGTHNYLTSFLENLSYNPSTPIFKPLNANLLSDSLTLAAFLWLDFPGSTTTAFTLNALAKYIPAPVAGRYSNWLQAVILADTLINLTFAYQQGQKFVPLLGTTFATLMGSFTGMFVGHHLGKYAAHLVNLIPQSIYHYYHPPVFNHDVSEQKTKAEQEEHQTDSYFSKIKSSLYYRWHTLFAKPTLAKAENLNQSDYSLADVVISKNL